ncbi:MAG TPA: DUF4384 domain-containing protein [Anaeromyxobacteraceae bacterium]|nr:DUF4384 domain-containing protein [Anaeromyxobacteraceae bacterium]
MNAVRHPSDLALEGYLMERERSKVAPHVGSCDTCRGRIARMEREGQEFLQYVFPATVEKIEEAAERGRRPAWLRLAYFVPVPLAGLAVALFIALAPGQKMTGPGEDYVGTKGAAGTLGLTVFLGSVEGAHPLRDGEAVPATSQLRFSVRTGKECKLWLLSVDAAGEVSRLFPTSGDRAADVAKGGLQPLPGGAVLDGKAGPERIFAVCSPEPVSYAQVERAAKSAVVPGESAVRSVGVIPGLPDGTSQATVLIEKKP